MLRLNALLATVACIGAAIPVSASQAQEGWYTREDFQPSRRIAVTVTNDLDQPRSASPVVITPDQIPGLAGAHELTVTLVDPLGTPRPLPSAEELAIMGPHGIREEANGRAIDMQMDDLDKDGVWDELFFQTDLGAGETKTYYLYLGFQQRGWNPHGSNAAIGSYMRHVVPFWESQHVGWKLWFPTDVDVYGKREGVLMSSGLLGQNWDGYAVSYVDPAYGSDIQSVDDSFGGGGIGLFETPGSDALSRPRFSPGADAENRFNGNQLEDTRYAFEVVVNGPLRSTVRVKTLNWDTGNGSYALEQLYTAYANHNYATARVHFSTFEPNDPGTEFAAGIRRRAGETLSHIAPGVVVTAAPDAIRNPDDLDTTQNALEVEYAGTALIAKDMYDPRHVWIDDWQGNHVFRFPRQAEDRYEYMIAAGWSEGAVLKTAEEFRDYVIGIAREYNAPVRLVSATAENRE